MALPRDRSLLVKAARMYYEQDLSQDQIATALGVSRSNVSRMLTDARAQGIVQIRIVEHAMRDTALENRLKEVLPIRQVRVARSLNSIDEYAAVGALAAEALSERLRPNSTVAISWGATLQSMANAMEASYLPGVHLVPMVGGMTALSAGASGEDLLRSMAAKMSASASAVLAPAVVSSREARDAFMQEPSVAGVLEQTAQADVAVVGIGSKRASSTMELLHTAGLPDAMYDALMNDMAGDIAARFYDLAGNEVDHGWSDRIVGIDLAQLRRIPNVIGIAAGQVKAGGVIGAVRGGFITELVVSSSCALAIVRQLDVESEARAS